jgi:superfamily II DNA or RNA helicase
MTDIYLEKIDQTYLRISSEEHILREIQDKFTFYADGYKFHPKYKAKLWDGRIRMLRIVSRGTGLIYLGLLHQIISFAKNSDYSIELDSNLKYKDVPSEESLKEYLKNLKPASKGQELSPRSYQEKGFIDAIQRKRQLLLSVTASGKSLIIYSIVKYLHDQGLNGLVIVPNVTLAHQIFNDFDDYSSINQWNVYDNVHKIFSGQEKITNKSVTISTWQSLMNIKSKAFFSKYDFVLIDEGHSIKGKELGAILEKCTNASYRIGLTGTIDNCKANINTIIGLTGEVNRLNTTSELVDKGEIAKFDIQCLVLKYDQETSKLMKKAKYQDEVNYLVTNKKRNNFIKNLALSTTTNTIILFQYVEKHGKVLYDLIKESKKLDPDRKVFFIHGGVEGEERERIRQLLEHETNAIVLASVQIMGTGTSIKNLHNIIFAINGKSSIRILQSIGRALRLHQSKDSATIYDIVDDLSHKESKNHSLNHFMERIKIYSKENFTFKINRIDFE